MADLQQMAAANGYAHVAFPAAASYALGIICARRDTSRASSWLSCKAGYTKHITAFSTAALQLHGKCMPELQAGLPASVGDPTAFPAVGWACSQQEHP